MQINSNTVVEIIPSSLTSKKNSTPPPVSTKFQSKFVIPSEAKTPHTHLIALSIFSGCLCLSFYLLTRTETPDQPPSLPLKKSVSAISKDSSDGFLTTIANGLGIIASLASTVGCGWCLIPERENESKKPHGQVAHKKGPVPTPAPAQTSFNRPSTSASLTRSKLTWEKMSRQDRNSLIITFYQGNGPEASGNTIKQLWELDDATKESRHDYIQWLFPLTEPSDYNLSAPVLTKALISNMKQDTQTILNFQKSFEAMMKFYGWKYDERTNKLINATNFKEREENLLDNPHNFLRLTRILKCLNLFGLRDHATALMTKLNELYNDHRDVIGPRAYNFWSAAAAGK